MGDSLFGSRIACGNTAYKRSQSDFYPTPPAVTQALIDFLRLSKHCTKIWEPACGDGHMTDVFRANGYEVIATDILYGQDYMTTETPVGVTFIVTNPPFSRSKDFIHNSIERQMPFAFLLKSQFWHSKSRYDLFYMQPPTYVLPLTWRPDFLFKKRGNGAPLMDVMWCVWLPGHTETKYRPLARPMMGV